jgi:hypothetical protein
MVALIYIIFGLKKQHKINFHEKPRKVEENLHEGGRCMFVSNPTNIQHKSFTYLTKNRQFMKK